MSREEEIIEAGIEYTMKKKPNMLAGDKFSEEMREYNRNKVFEEGAKWADEHPKEGLVSIAKVCEWLKNNVYEYTSVVNHDTEETNVELTTDFKSFDEFIDAFSKSMKE